MVAQSEDAWPFWGVALPPRTTQGGYWPRHTTLKSRQHVRWRSRK